MAWLFNGKLRASQTKRKKAPALAIKLFGCQNGL
jgi:hypothetical protein